MNPGLHSGEYAALATALCWTCSTMVFAAASKKGGALVVNLMKLILAVGLLAIYTQITRGMPLPLDASPRVWFWMSLSGLAGLAFADYFLFSAFIRIGARISMLIMATSPLFAALLGWIMLGETLAVKTLLGMALTLGGISMAVLERKTGDPGLTFSHAPAGILFAFGGAVGQAAGWVLSKYGLGTYDVASATQIRELAGILGFGVLIVLSRSWGRVGTTLRDFGLMRLIVIGSIFGPFAGITLSLYAVQHANIAAASTIIAIVPIFIIPPAIIFLKEKVTFKEALGAVVAVAGVFVLFL